MCISLNKDNNCYRYSLEKVGKQWHAEEAGEMNCLCISVISYQKDEKGCIHIIDCNSCQIKRLNSSKCSDTLYLLPMRKAHHTGMKHVWTFVSNNLSYLQLKIKLS